MDLDALPANQQPLLKDEPVGLSEERLPWTLGDIIRAILSVVGVAIVGTVPVYLVAALIADGMEEIDEDPTALAVLLMSTLLSQIAALAAVWYFTVRKYDLRWESVGLRRPEKGWPWLPFVLFLGAMATVVLYGLALETVGVNPDTDLPDAAYDNLLPLAVVLALTTIMAPFVEEVFFRGFIFAGLTQRFGWIWGAVGSSLLWGAAHLGNSGYLYVIPPIVLIGLLFAWSYRYSRSLFPPIAAHFMFNALQMVFAVAAN